MAVFPFQIAERFVSEQKLKHKSWVHPCIFIYTLPFVSGFSEILKRELQKQGIRVAFKRGQTQGSMRVD